MPSLFIYYADCDDMTEITPYLLDLTKDHIYQLGLSLGLSTRTVRDTRDISPCARYLSDTLEAWLRVQDKVLDKSGPPTWRSLAKALKHETIRQNGIAARIEQDKKLQ